MANCSIGTAEVLAQLTSEGMPEAQAKIIVSAIAESHADLVTKDDLTTETNALKHYLLWRM